MKIIIVGAGVSGLSTYLLLQQHLPPRVAAEVVIYDAHLHSAAATSAATRRAAALSDSAAVVGNSIILPPSSIRLLRQMDARLYELFKSRGFENQRFTLRSARGHALATVPTDDGVAPREGSISCPRWVLWECLQEVVGREKIRAGKVVDVVLRHGARPRVVFAHGAAEEADLVVGADGVHSVVKRALFGEAAYPPQFEGYRGVGSFVDVDALPDVVTQQRSAVVTFGPTGSFGYAAAAPLEQRRLGWWSNWPAPELLDSNFMSAADVRQQLRARHGRWPDPVIQQCIAHSTTECVYPLWTTPDLPHWGDRGCVLLGDAAHCLQATSGQGAAQALEDSATFVLLLKHYLHPPARAPSPPTSPRIAEAETIAARVDAASKALYELRHERVAGIRDRARNLYVGRRAITGVVREYLHYCYIFLLLHFPMLGYWMIGSSFRECHEWRPAVEVQRYLARS